MIADLIEDHRAMYRADVGIDRLVTTQPPVQLDVNTGIVRQIEAERYSGGMYLAGRLHRLLGHPDGYGSDFPWLKAWWKLRAHCRRNHEYHRAADRPYWRGSLCHQLVRFVIVQEWTVQRTASLLRYDNPEPVLRSAFAFIEQTMDDFRAKAEKRAREDEGHGPGALPPPTVVHHSVPGLHQEECPQCRAA